MSSPCTGLSANFQALSIPGLLRTTFKSLLVCAVALPACALERSSEPLSLQRDAERGAQPSFRIGKGAPARQPRDDAPHQGKARAGAEGARPRGFLRVAAGVLISVIILESSLALSLKVPHSHAPSADVFLLGKSPRDVLPLNTCTRVRSQQHC